MRVIENERNLGWVENFHSTALGCSSELVAFSDQDDVWLPPKIELCAAFFSAHPGCPAVVHSATVVDDRLRRSAPDYPSFRETKLVPRQRADPWYSPPGFAMVFDAGLLRRYDWRSRPPSRDLDGADHLMDHDEWIYFLAWAEGQVGFISEPLALYRQHEANVLGAPARHLLHQISKALSKPFAPQAGRSEAAHGYAAYLTEAAAGAGGAKAQALREAAAYFQRFERLSRQRDGLYDGRGVVGRVTRLGSLAAGRGYRSRERGGLGGIAFLRDVRQAVLGR